MLFARPQHSEAPANTTTEARKNRLRPNRSLSLPARERARTMPTEYAVMTQLVQLMEVCSPRWIACSAVATMVPSSELMSRASATTEKIATRCSRGRGPRYLRGGGHRGKTPRSLVSRNNIIHPDNVTGTGLPALNALRREIGNHGVEGGTEARRVMTSDAELIGRSLAGDGQSLHGGDRPPRGRGRCLPRAARGARGGRGPARRRVGGGLRVPEDLRPVVRRGAAVAVRGGAEPAAALLAVPAGRGPACRT